MTFLKVFVRLRTGVHFAFASFALTVLAVPIWLLMFSTVISGPPSKMGDSVGVFDELRRRCIVRGADCHCSSAGSFGLVDGRPSQHAAATVLYFLLLGEGLRAGNRRLTNLGMAATLATELDLELDLGDVILGQPLNDYSSLVIGFLEGSCLVFYGIHYGSRRRAVQFVQETRTRGCRPKRNTRLTSFTA